MEPITRTCKYRVLYADTDMMGVVYYGNYGRLFEMGRTEMIREMGMPYIGLEKTRDCDASLFGGVEIPECTELR